MTYTDVSALTWANAEHTAVDCQVLFDGLGLLPFTASPADAEEHSVEIFTRASAGEFGAIEPFPVPPAPTLEDEKVAKLKALASRRWQAETSGTTVNGVAVMTDRESQSLITGAALAATLDAGYSAAWKTAAGVFVTLTAAEILAVAQGVRAHVQACFNREAELATAITDAADQATLDVINIDTGWPG